MSAPLHSSLGLEKASYYMPYQTTSTQAMETTLQAMETLAGGVGYGAPRHVNRPIASKKKKGKSRFTLCGLGSNNVDMYDDGLNTSFVASARPGDMIMGKIQGSNIVHKVVPPMPPVEYSPGQMPAEANRRKRTKTIEPGCSLASNVLHRPSLERQMASRSVHRLNPSETTQLTSFDSIDSLGPKAQVMTAVRANRSEAKLPRDHDVPFQGIPAQSLALRRKMGSDRGLSSDSPPLDGFYPAPRPKSSFALIRDPVKEQAESPIHRQKRRGGFIGSSSSSSIPLIDVEEASFVTENDCSDASPGNSRPFRSSIASTVSKYSVMSPCIDLPSTPKRATMGGEEDKYHQYHESAMTASIADRSSMTSTNRTLSISTSASLQESSRSPAIGDVLSSFPNLPDTASRDSAAIARYSRRTDDDYEERYDDEIPTRINTFGLARRRDYEYKDEYSAVGHINSFQYNDSHPELDLCRRPSSPCDTSPTSTPSSSDSVQTASSGLSRRSQKRVIVLCGLPSHNDLAALSRGSDVGDLTWEEGLLKMSRGKSSSSISEAVEDVYSSEFSADDTIHAAGDCTLSRRRSSKETLRSTMTSNHKRSRGSSSTQAAGPFSPPPDLPLPPVPSKRKTGPILRSPNSLASIAAQSSSLQQRSFRTTLPRSITCPDLGEGGYAY